MARFASSHITDPLLTPHPYGTVLCSYLWSHAWATTARSRPYFSPCGRSTADNLFKPVDGLRFGSPGGILIRTGHTARAGASRRNHSNQHRQRRYFHVSWRDLTYPPPSRCRNAACRFGNLNDHCGRRSGCARPPWPILYRAGSLASGLPPELKRELRQKLVDAIVASVVKSPIVFVIVDTIVASVKNV